MGRNNTAASGISHDPSVIVPSTSVKIARAAERARGSNDDLQRGRVLPVHPNSTRALNSNCQRT
jgi:hypothetical protein